MTGTEVLVIIKTPSGKMSSFASSGFAEVVTIVVLQYFYILLKICLCTRISDVFLGLAKHL
jgi:hypothetical protein